MAGFLGKMSLVVAAIGLPVFLLAGNYAGLHQRSLKNVSKEILTGSTFSVLAGEMGIATSTANEMLSAAKNVYDLATIVAGKEIIFGYDPETDELQKLVYDINQDEQLVIARTASTSGEVWNADKIAIPYTSETASVSGIIDESLYKTVISTGQDERLALALAEMFAWQIDFAGEIQKGDSFKVIYEKKFRDGSYDHPGKILAAEFVNAGEKSQGYYFRGDETREGYYDENGNSLQKVFLKAPLQYKYISSGYTNRRFNPILNEYTRHRGIDYAAPSGTPAVSVGDGTVIQAGWNGQYGISVKVRHNDTYTTVYGHFSGLARGIKVGARVKQGQIVGYVGSTGLSTGPHLHYEMHKFGSFINPFTEKVPSIEPVKEGDRAAFSELKDKYQKELAKI